MESILTKLQYSHHVRIMSPLSLQDRYINADVDREWKQYNPSDDESGFGWEDYRKLVYGFLDASDGGLEDSDDQVYK